jgi:pilus assembly protein CpaB
MKSKTFVMMFLAIGCGLVAAYLTAKISARQATPDTQPVLVAKEKINAGQAIKDPEKLFVLMSYPTGSTPNAISNLDDLKNKIVAKTVQAGQWLTPDDITGNYGIELPKGYYAMSVKVDATQAASGFILPKSRVNVVATIKAQGLNSRPKVVTILQDVLVLAIDQTSIRQEDKMAYGQVSNALLAVKPADSQKLALAQSMGEVRLVLRSHDDDKKVPLAELEYAGADTLTGDDGMLAPKAVQKPTYRLAVAKQDLEVGTTIDDPEKFFDVKVFTDLPAEAVAERGLTAFKGKTLKHSLFKDAVLTGKHFRGEEFQQVAAKPVENQHLMFIQNGGAAPELKVYVNGVVKTPEDLAAEKRAATKDKDKKSTDTPAGGSSGEAGKS